MKVMNENSNLHKNFNLVFHVYRRSKWPWPDLTPKLVDIMNMLWGMCIPSINMIGVGKWKLWMETCNLHKNFNL